MKTNLLVSVSGGKTSGKMAEKIKREYSHLYNLLFIFANTGEEDSKSLIFLDKIDKEFLDGSLVWVEALVHEGRVGTTYKVVTFETASRNGEPFEEVIKKYGIPNKSYIHCTRELKLAPIHSYGRDYFGSDDYETAVGIRIDEARRVSDRTKYNIVYPFIDWEFIDKIDVNNWWSEQSFNLDLEEFESNCKTCFKKTNSKHFKIIDKHAEYFDFNRRMEKYAHIKAPDKDRVFFRSHRDTDALFLLHSETAEDRANKAEMEKYIRTHQPDMFDENDGCGESCEMYPMRGEQER